MNHQLDDAVVSAIRTEQNILYQRWIRMWISRANDKEKTIICARESFNEANRIGQLYCKTNKITFYLREYIEVERVNQLLEYTTEARQKIELVMGALTKAISEVD